MATLISDLIDYIATQAGLTVDTDLFLGSENPNADRPFAILKEIPGSTENWSGFERQIFQLQVKGDSYVSGKTLVDTLYDIINHKPGFADATLSTHNIYYCKPTGMPYLIGRDDRNSYIWAVNFIIKRS